MDVVCAVLAAGLSTRLGRPKQLLEFRGKPLIRHAAEVAVRVGKTIVVVPSGQFHDLIKDLDVTIIDNDRPQDGVSVSIHRAVEAARGARILFTLCDQPLVTSEHLRALVAEDAPIVATGYRGIAGVPAVFAPQFASELLALRGDRGARSVIDAHRDETTVIPFEDAGVDIDTDADYLKL
ncbi:MAG TPA: nucleotidyltransferase family protein [Thermoanaerobaculia bacterium]|nr:nucleotidyltransferase family protein [Thermoanaerobaculia bacterium]